MFFLSLSAIAMKTVGGPYSMLSTTPLIVIGLVVSKYFATDDTAALAGLDNGIGADTPTTGHAAHTRARTHIAFCAMMRPFLHSARIARTGSVVVALHAGTSAAMAPTITKTSGAAMKVDVSSGVRPKSIPSR